jgi:hypothetical protein
MWNETVMAYFKVCSSTCLQGLSKTTKDTVVMFAIADSERSDVVVKRKILPCWELNPDHPAHSLVTMNFSCCKPWGIECNNL